MLCLPTEIFSKRRKIYPQLRRHQRWPYRSQTKTTLHQIHTPTKHTHLHAVALLLSSRTPYTEYKRNQLFTTPRHSRTCICTPTTTHKLVTSAHTPAQPFHTHNAHTQLYALLIKYSFKQHYQQTQHTNALTISQQRKQSATRSRAYHKHAYTYIRTHARMHACMHEHTYIHHSINTVPLTHSVAHIITHGTTTIARSHTQT